MNMGKTLWIVCAESGQPEPRAASGCGEDAAMAGIAASGCAEAASSVVQPHSAWRRRAKMLHDECGRYVCDVCGKAYSRGDSLAHHRSIHRGDTVCPICQAVFTRKYTMHCHLVKVHGVKVKA